MDNHKAAILGALENYAAKRPGFEPGNYATRAVYASEMRAAVRDLHVARRLIREVALHDSITAADILAAAKSGRVTLIPGPYGCTVSYCTGQYFAVEFRPAIARLMAEVLWHWTREHAMPAPMLHHNSETGETVERHNGLRAGDWLRRHFRKQFGASIARRFFD